MFVQSVPDCTDDQAAGTMMGRTRAKKRHGHTGLGDMSHLKKKKKKPPTKSSTMKQLVGYSAGFRGRKEIALAN